jgi:hypothetical protein
LILWLRLRKSRQNQHLLSLKLLPRTLRKKESKPKREPLRKQLRPNKKELLALRTLQAMSLQYATSWPPGTTLSSMLPISLEGKLSQESLEE